MSTAGEYLGKKMKERGIGPSEMADLIGLASPSNISEWITGARPIPVHHALNLAKYSGARHSTLLNKIKGVKPAKAKRAKVFKRITPTPQVIAEEPVVTLGKSVWFDIRKTAPPTEELHVRYNAKEKKVHLFEGTRHAPHPDYTKWAYLQLPEPPKS